MKRCLSHYLLAAGLLLAAAAHAVPTQLSANAGEVRDIRFASGSGATAVLYAATQGGGVFKSADAGQTWAATGLNTGYAWKIAVSPLDTLRVYAATDNGLWRTTNAGANWTQLTFDPARAVAIDPGSATNDTVLLGVSGQGILRSTDNGATFTRQSTGLDSMDVTQIVYQSNGVAYAVLDCNYQDIVLPHGDGNWGGVFRSANANAAALPVIWASYQSTGSGAALPTKCIKAIAANSTRVFVGTYDPFGASGQVYRTDGSGWTGPASAVPQDGNLFGVESLAIDRFAPETETTIHGGSRAIGVWSSTTNGVTYVQKVDPTAACCDPDMWTRIYAIETVPGLANTVLAAAKGVGIMRSTNFNLSPANQISWSVAPGIKADRVRGLANHAITAQNTYWMALENGGVMKSTDAGGTWAEFNSGFDFGSFPSDILLSATAIAADPSNLASVIVGTRGGGLLQLNSSQNGWTNIGLPAVVQLGGIDFKPQQALIPSTNLVYYTLFDGPGGGKAGGLLRSNTGPAGLAQTVYPGDITLCPPPQPAGALGSGHKVVQTSSSRAYFLRYSGLPYRSLDNFASNTAFCITAPNVGFERLAFNDIAENPITTTTLVGATNKGIFRSTDSGVNWSRVAISGLNSQVLAALGYVSNVLFGIDRAGGFYCSANDGTTWQAKPLGGLPAVPFRDMVILSGAVHILTDGGGVYNGFTATCP